MSARWKSMAVLVVALLVAVGMYGCGSDSDESDANGETTAAIDGESAYGITGVGAEACGEVEFDGAGDADVLIASDLPLHGAAQARSEQMNDAIRIALNRSGWMAGGLAVAFQACDDSLADTGAWDADVCRENAEAYVETADLVGVVGTYNSGCAAEMLPILNGAPVALVSPGNTMVCLTRAAADCPANEPARFAPSGERSYARVVPNDADQAAGLVTFVGEQGWTDPVVLHAADDPTSLGQAVAFANAAEEAGIDVGEMLPWDPEADDYTELMRQVAAREPDAVLLAGLTEQNGGAVIAAKVDVLGSNQEVALLAPDGFAQQSTIDEAGEAAAGMYVSVPGRAPEALTGPGAEVVSALAADHDPVELYAPYAAQAVDVLLQAIEAGGADRAAVASSLFEVEIADGVIGSFEIGPDGDPTINPITIFQAHGTFAPVEEIEPDEDLVAAARG